MRIFVDKLPKCCSDCPCESDIWCNLMGYVLDTEDVYEKRPKQCPLQSLTDYTKQVRKEVCEEIREFLKNNKYKVVGQMNLQKLEYEEYYICEFDEINKFLDQIQGETK